MASNRSTQADMFDLADWAQKAEAELAAAIEAAKAAAVQEAEDALTWALSHLRAMRAERNLPALRELKAHWENTPDA